MPAHAKSDAPSPLADKANLAALATWLVPGAGHLLLGRTTLALVAFALVEGLFWTGLQLSGGMTFEYLDHELRTLLAPVLSPEAGNLGGFVYQMRSFGYGEIYPRPWPQHIALGSLLTCLSGMANVFLMAHAHLVARTGRADLDREGNRPVVAMMLAWVVPGLGHLYQGRRVRGVVVFAALVGLFALGTWMAEGTNLSRERHFYYWAGQFVVGAPAILAELVGGDLRVTAPIAFVDAGLVFACVAGLLNILAMIDVYGYGEAVLLGLPFKTHAASPPEGAVRGGVRAAEEARA